MPAPPCSPGCLCGKHRRRVLTPEHKARIGLSVSMTAEAKGYNMTPKAVRDRRAWHRRREGIK